MSVRSVRRTGECWRSPGWRDVDRRSSSFPCGDLYSSYAIAGWSPDGRQLLLMSDVGGGFSMTAVTVEPPFASKTVVAYARVNTARSWPGNGDVSWQPAPRW
jgi:hypothetical protein